MRACVFFALFLTLAGSAAAQTDSRAEPPDETRLLNTPVPDVWLTTAAGDRIALSTLSLTRPLVLGFVFTRCAGVCSPFLRSWRAADGALAIFFFVAGLELKRELLVGSLRRPADAAVPVFAAAGRSRPCASVPVPLVTTFCSA